MRNFKFIGLGFMFSLVWAFAASYFLVFLGVNDVSRPAQMTYQPFWYIAFFACIWAPIWEEFTFRYAPLTIAKNLRKELFWPIFVLSSALFGWCHGQAQEGLLIQGVVGMIFAWTYLQTGEIWCSILLHSLYNSFIIFAPLIFKSLTFLSH